MYYIFIIIITLELSIISNATKSICGSSMYSLYNTQDDAFCYERTENDGLPLLDESSWIEDSVYFIDSSCKGGLNVREACSVEAAAKVNPSRQVNVFFAGPVTEACIQSEPVVSLLTYINVQLKRIYVKEYSDETGLSDLLTSSVINTGPYPNLYALDLLKFITLFKFDGVYMDLDMMATRPFDELPKSENWLSIEDHKQEALSSAIFAASSDKVGRQFINSVISMLLEQKASSTWREYFDSFTVLKEAVELLTGHVPFNRSKNGYSFFHNGMILYASQFFFPIPCESSKEYFSSSLDVRNLSRSYTQQLCNALTYQDSIDEDSTYARLMGEYCPKVYGYFVRTGFAHRI